MMRYHLKKTLKSSSTHCLVGDENRTHFLTFLGSFCVKIRREVGKMGAV